MKKILFSIIALTLASSCSNDFISLLPRSTVSVDVMYKNDKDFADAMIGVYNSIQAQYQNFNVFGDIRGDDSEEQIFKNNSQAASDLFTITSSDALVGNAWRNYYQAIFRANTILEKLAPMDTAAVPNKARYEAEARFLRALCYFDLVRIFGGVPAITTTLTIEESYKVPRETVENVYSRIIIPDLTAAEALPTSWGGSEVGKPTGGAAKALLGRVYLTIKDYPKAEAKLMEVTGMGYDLLPDYNDLFDYSRDEHHSEYIFDIEYESGMGEGSNFTTSFFPNFSDMNTYYGIVGAGQEHNNPTAELIALFEENDLRKRVSVGVTGGFWDDENVFHALPTSTNQTYTMKYFTNQSVINDSNANWKVIRYGDVLLMLAEALNENNKTAQAVPWINEIRSRAGVSTYPVAISQSDMRAAIEKERRLELSFEGVRWFDLVRTGKAYDALKDEGMTQHMTLFPIPLSQVQLINDPAILSQNPGYD
jgi:hypothetical protein